MWNLTTSTEASPPSQGGLRSSSSRRVPPFQADRRR
jgi:hypothetical protein